MSEIAHAPPIALDTLDLPPWEESTASESSHRLDQIILSQWPDDHVFVLPDGRRVSVTDARKDRETFRDVVEHIAREQLEEATR